MPHDSSPAPVVTLGISGFSNSGKTTLIEAMISRMTGPSCIVVVIKHSHHHVVPFQLGSDSERFRSAGASDVLLSAANGLEQQGQWCPGVLPTLKELLNYAGKSAPDLVLLEGFKDVAGLPRLWLHRGNHLPSEQEEAYLARSLAVVTDYPALFPALTRLPLDNPDEVARWVQLWRAGFTSTNE
ncbi:molybdopterin-guanine dinucleotide biosynthesis protein B [Larsenimonas rhizosphaerae]|uniref:molybdopterin-guanine dinucleotide biosynthesis protein B n=1 Tax=Larsenimonas rhizosphaerae TaxID=2944682 RepID=UPI002033FDDD|nr:molybdopterin-guanine dinucleotide biosynthesis protein B [Larsenimonas rhizosphaerae]MCM2130454.1 molybdopterin-guanine dinucleotide biosynthesis protein B [Larsenimonas rhizosphaerae]